MRLYSRFSTGLLAFAATLLPSALLSQEHSMVTRLAGWAEWCSQSPAPRRHRKSSSTRMAVLHSFWWEEGDRAFGDVLEADSTCAMAHWGIAVNAWGNPFAGGPAQPAAMIKASRRLHGHPLFRCGPARERGFVAAAAALYRDAESTSQRGPASGICGYDGAAVSGVPQGRRGRDLLLAEPAGHGPEDRHHLRPAAASHRDPGAALRPAPGSSRPRPLRHPRHRQSGAGSPGTERGPAYAQIAPAAPHAQHMPSHIFVRLGLWNETIASNWKSYRAGADYAKAMDQPGAPEELHALDYAVYGYLQRGQDSAAQAAVAEGRKVKTNTKSLVAGYNRTAMAARVPLERGDWEAAAEFPAPADSVPPIATALAKFTRAIGSARSGRAEAAVSEVKALDSITTALEDKSEPYWSRVVGIKRDVAESWVRLAAGDTAGALQLAKAAADSEEVTDKHPVTPAELLPARELEGDMLLLAGHYAEARAAYRATLARERNRARSIFGMARAAELAGDKKAAAESYREFLKLMAKADGDRPELASAETFAKRCHPERSEGLGGKGDNTVSMRIDISRSPVRGVYSRDATHLSLVGLQLVRARLRKRGHRAETTRWRRRSTGH